MAEMGSVASLPAQQQQTPLGVPDEPLTLAGMLRRFTAPEKLGKAYDCAKCGPGQNAKRRLCVKKLPPVLSFQLKVSAIVQILVLCFKESHDHGGGNDGIALCS